MVNYIVLLKEMVMKSSAGVSLVVACMLTSVVIAEDSCKCDPMPTRYFTFKTDGNGKIIEDKDGRPTLIASEQSTLKASAPVVRALAANQLEVTEDCTTGPTGTGGRTSCESGGSVLTVPAGYVFVKDREQRNREIGYGSENDEYTEYSDYVDVIPGLQAPRTVKCWVHARSGRDQGERGRTKTHFVFPYIALP